jgi:AcrR family transcriptional regulator
MSEKLNPESKPGADTRGRLLCAAERLLVERGYAGMSARAVAQSAQVNIASASYHFGSKQGVLEAVVQWRLAPMNRARLTRLESVLTNPSHTVEDILYAFLWPCFETEPDGPVRLLMGRLMAEPTAVVGPVIEETFRDVAKAFVSALEKRLPDASRESLTRKLSFVVGATSFTLLNKNAALLAPEDHLDQTFKQLLSFCVQGVEASPDDTELSEEC